jgi:hypothetical protein
MTDLTLTRPAPKVTILFTAHAKPCYLDAIDSLLAQTFTDWECIVMDSEVRPYPYGNGTDRIHVAFTQEPLNFKEMKCHVGWCFNEAVRRGWVRGEYLQTFYDDDLMHPQYLEKMVGFLEADIYRMAVRCSQDRVYLLPDGTVKTGEPLIADKPIVGDMLYQVDGGQVLMRSEILDRIDDPWLPEDPEDAVCRISDGLFLNKVGAVIDQLHYIPDHLYTHRFSPWSTYTPSV